MGISYDKVGLTLGRTADEEAACQMSREKKIKKDKK